MLSAKEISFSYHYDTIFDKANLLAYPNQLTVIRGQSGCGKSTLFNLLSLKHGLIIDIFLDDANIKDDPLNYLQQLYYITQEPVFCDELTIEQQWKLLQETYGPLDLDPYISILGLTKSKHLYPKQLSGGEKLRVSFINALIIRPKILLMDEPTSSLDEEYKKRFIELLDELKKDRILLIATHDESIMQQADVLYEIKHHQLIEVKRVIHEASSLQQRIKQKVNWFYYFWKMKRHHIFKETLTVCFIAFSITMCAFTINMDQGFTEYYQQYLSSLESMKTFVYKALDNRYPEYSYDGRGVCFPITTQEYNIISQINHIVSIKPKTILSTIVPLEYREYSADFTIYKDDTDIFDYSEEDDLFYLEGIEDDDVEECLSVRFDNKDNGVYFNQTFLNEWHLDAKDIKGGYVKIEIGIPVYDVSGEFIKSYADSEMIPANYHQVTPVTLLLPINGVLEGRNSQMISFQTNKTLYISSDYLLALIDDYKVDQGMTIYYDDDVNEVSSLEEASYTSIYTPYQPNGYIIEIDSYENSESVVNSIRELGYIVDWEYSSFQDYGTSIRNTKQLLGLLSICFMSFVIVVLGLVHLIKGKNEHFFNCWLKDIGFRERKDLLEIKAKKYLLNAMITFALCIVMDCIINESLAYMIFQRYYLTFGVMISMLVISLIIQVMIPMVWEFFDYMTKQ